MITVQIDAITKQVKATVWPPVEADPPPGVEFHLVDDSQETIDHTAKYIGGKFVKE